MKLMCKHFHLEYLVLNILSNLYYLITNNTDSVTVFGLNVLGHNWTDLVLWEKAISFWRVSHRYSVKIVSLCLCSVCRERKQPSRKHQEKAFVFLQLFHLGNGCPWKWFYTNLKHFPLQKIHSHLCIKNNMLWRYCAPLSLCMKTLIRASNGTAFILGENFTRTYTIC